MRKAITGVMGALLLVAAMAAPAAAQTYGGGAGPTVSLSSTTLVLGQPLVITMNGFPANTGLAVTFFSTPVVLGSVTTDATGSAVLSTQIPSSAALGAHDVVASGGGASASAALTVVAQGTTPPPATPRPTRSGGLAFTGANVTSLALVALALLGFGGAALAKGRRRRRSA